MLRKFITLLLISLSLLSATSSHAEPELRDIQGNSLHLSDFRGKWIVINYWAAWCAPCRQEVPELNTFYQAHKDKDAVVLGVSYDQDTDENLRRAAKKMAINFPVLSTDPANLLGIDPVAGLPTSYLISPDGKLQRTLLGNQTQKSLEKAMSFTSKER